MKQQKFMRVIAWLAVITFPMFFSPGSGDARVTGACGNCHTMHNSQGGSAVVVMGTGAGWDASGNLVGVTQATAGASLTVSNCVGCHSSSTSDTIIEQHESRIPIVYNTVEPAEPLAGGNFYWVVNGNPSSHPGSLPEEFGHNVKGISARDSLVKAPGGFTCGSGETCHSSLAESASMSSPPFNQTGCQGCHVYVAHHADVGSYRFLEGHIGAAVEGVEDADWEQKPTSTTHNEYKGSTLAFYTGHNMSGYCKGCHTDFHNQTDGSSWIRHPSDGILPSTGQYAGYTVYSPEAPVARPDPGSVGDHSVVTPGTDMVMCLSCHRPHGSPNPDILRWDYNTMNAGITGASAGKGCFVCHTNKDGV